MLIVVVWIRRTITGVTMKLMRIRVDIMEVTTVHIWGEGAETGPHQAILAMLIWLPSMYYSGTPGGATMCPSA